MGLHILVPVDGSPKSEKAFEYVLEQFSEPTITLIYVINPVNFSDAIEYARESNVNWGGSGATFDSEGYQKVEQRPRKQAEQITREFRNKATAHGVEAEIVITTGKPAKQILETAGELEIDHIVIGSHSRLGLSRVLFGSVAEAVTRRSPTPVTIVR